MIIITVKYIYHDDMKYKYGKIYCYTLTSIENLALVMKDQSSVVCDKKTQNGNDSPKHQLLILLLILHQTMSKSVVLSAGTILGGEGIPSNSTTNNSVNNNSNNNSNNSNSLSHTTHRVHCLAHTSTPPRHVRVGVHQLILPRPMQCEQLIQLGIRSSDNNAGSTNTSSGGADDDNVRNIRCTHVWSNEEVELRVEATLWCMGMEIHSCVIGTHRQEPFGKGKEDKEEGEVEEESDTGHMDRYQNKKRSRQYITWDDVLVFPFRWRDLTRDACITFQGKSYLI